MGKEERCGGEGRRDWSRQQLRVRPRFVLALLVAAVAVIGGVKMLAGGALGVFGCTPAGVPATASSSLGTLKSVVVGSGLQALPAGGRPDVEGLQQPGSSWSDTPPGSAPRGFNLSSGVGDGYEVRWWSSPQDHQVADVFVFRRARDATRYVQLAASVGCHSDAAEYRLADPVGARALAWTNPLGFRQADVFFSRGTRAFRLAEVVPATYLEGPFRFDTAELIGLPQLLACRLSQADCLRPRPRPALSAAGYDALKVLAAAEARLRFEPPAKASGEIGRACFVIGRFWDPEARLIYEDCQVSLHFLSVGQYANDCYQGDPCQQWATKAATADVYRAAALEQQLAGQLTAGACRAQWQQEITTNLEFGRAGELYAQALTDRDHATRQHNEARARLLDQRAYRHYLTPNEILIACAPRGASLSQPGLT